jgi:hypothetical protein
MPRKSHFARGLQKLLDNTKTFSREEWAVALGVSPGVIAEWVEDEARPTESEVNLIIELVARCSALRPRELRVKLEQSGQLRRKSWQQLEPLTTVQ